jgi:hypothetical protein
MKTAIVTVKQLGIACWSIKRFLDQCHECNRVKYCKLPEARAGRIYLYYKKLDILQAAADKVRNQLQAEMER